MRRTLAALMVAVTSMVALAFLVPLALIVRETAQSRAVAGAERQASALVPVLALTTRSDDLGHAMARTEAGRRGLLAVHVQGGATVGTPRAPAAQVAGAAARTRASTVELDGGYVLLRPVALDGDRGAVIEVFVPADDLNRGVLTSWAVLTGVAVVLVLGSVLVGDRLGARVVRAARRLGTAAGALGSGDLSERIHPDGPPELKAAANAFNTMANRVTQLLAAERELAADLSHRLRTPLTALKLSLDQLGPEAEPSRQALARLETEVTTVISAARRPSRTARSCDAAEVLRERLAFWSALAEDQGRPWRLVGATLPVRAPVPAGELTAVVDALLGNVFRHTPEGTAFSVTLHEGRDVVGILVADAGPGIPDPEAALERGASGSGSTGLGLDIARRLAESTGGSLRLDRSSLGGAQVQVWLRSEKPTAPRGGDARAAL
ncbi:periplasmic sensor signal transduction histidine kinase [[Actinomadura] parvosata subsp. kistnae]|uniref:Signal transduction histidine-protein kinase/phosphatase MprB n=1 Tax=[Actinomadura] parvosata subsp. kistnae TaxID=1909395 RepID=A0A1V0AHV0_9ACTN|nr:HAMP domain-containing sensor histidine kinase [Nonomuraea sp. ATCC 55076]AQZ69790.1 two-component sensor histidine kinase [Nonomuraea sp. ATCC 55076]SPL90075.1 periplasmic sensor signal transduction histidine kinase [Actinomadura parvosata subsp. kistnae]